MALNSTQPSYIGVLLPLPPRDIWMAARRLNDRWQLLLLEINLPPDLRRCTRLCHLPDMERLLPETPTED